MPCQQCENGKWKWGENGECEYETKEECEDAHPDGDSGGKMKNRNWYRMEVSEDVVADIYIFDFIGDWIDEMLNEIFGERISVTAKAFVQELQQLPESVKTLRVHVNSPGGDVFGAVAIANALRDQRAARGRAVETSVEGLAASAASIIIQAGDPVRVGDNALIMIHNPWTLVAGEANELRKYAQELDTIRDAIISTYQWHSKLESEEIANMMDETTWMDADDAVAKGFATEKVDGLKAAATIDPRGLTKLSIPEQYRERVEALLKPKVKSPEPPAPSSELPPGTIAQEEPACVTEVLRLCREANCLDMAEELIEQGLSMERVQDRVKAEAGRRTAAEARAKEIRARCETAKLPELAEGYIKGSMSLDDIGRHLAAITAKLDAIEIDNSLEPDQGARPKARINVSEIYRERNRLQLVSGNKE